RVPVLRRRDHGRGGDPAGAPPGPGAGGVGSACGTRWSGSASVVRERIRNGGGPGGAAALPPGAGDLAAEPEGDPVLHLVLRAVPRPELPVPGAVVPAARRDRGDRQRLLPDGADLRR